MKLRLRGDTLRLRLRKSDIDTLAAVGRVEEFTPFGKRLLVYSLNLDETAETPHAVLLDDEICVNLPKRQGMAWCRGKETSIVSAGVVPAVLIERDFVRSAVEEPDDYDRFMNPRTGRMPPARNPA